MRRLAPLLAALLFLACGKPSSPRPVLFLGLDGADWQLLDAYMKDGVMPNLAALAREGRTGVLTTIQPPLSPLVWTTMMTGVSPLEHGILDFTRISQAGTEEPITREERQVPAIWNLAGLQGKSVAVFGMWATWPAEPVKGLMVADRFFSFTSRESQPPPGIVHPPEREAWARETLRKIERETGYEAVKSYFPALERSELMERRDPYAHPVTALRQILIETRAYDALARSWLEETTPDLTILYFQGTDTIGHVFAPLSDRSVPDLYFAEVDRLLGEYRKWAEEHGAVLMLASDHGFLWDKPAQPMTAMTAASAGLWHRNEGMYLLWGPGIATGERQTGKVDQVCSTLLALLGLPPGKRIAGPPLPGAPDLQGEPVDYPWRPAPVPRVETTSGEEEVAKLRALGYLGSPGQAAPRNKRGETRTAASYNNQGLLLRQEGRTDQAARAFERALEIAPGSASALWNLSDLLAATDPDRSDNLLIRALEAGLADGAQRVLERARARPGLLDRAIAVRPAEAKLRLARGQARFERRQCAAALADFEEAARLSPAEPLAHLAHNGAGIARLCLGDPEGAARAFRRSLEIDPAQAEIRQALGQLSGV
ncbi:MAG TPA: alkaline phosphatase family protein [Thermoanaerobaculia bacterium]|nr:alkaline phosphatase family protein [Thermoanaerobaculia bacterium]